jgi:hypothetical protein
MRSGYDQTGPLSNQNNHDISDILCPWIPQTAFDAHPYDTRYNWKIIVRTFVPPEPLHLA